MIFQLELKNVGDEFKQWFLNCDSEDNTKCSFCGEDVREGYFCSKKQRIWHKNCFAKLNFNCGSALMFGDDHFDYWVLIIKKTKIRIENEIPQK